MAKLFNRAKMTTATTGSGTITLGSAVSGFQSFADAGVANNDVIQYVIEEGANFEIGTGTYTASGTTLTRTPTESSESDDSAITLAGQAKVSIVAIHADFNRLQHEGSDKVTVSATGASVTGNLTVSGTIPAGQLTGSLPAIDGSALTGIEGVPSGIIAIWSGSTSTIPTGWVICDGTNDTPDLRNNFVVGAGDTYAVDATGGSNTVTLAEGELPSHAHSFSANAATSNTGAHSHNGSTSNVGNHTHNIGNGRMDKYAGWAYVSSWATWNHGRSGPWSSGGAGSHSHNFSTSNTGNHSHNVSVSGNTGNVGSGTGHENRPPYYALAYIMKT